MQNTTINKNKYYKKTNRQNKIKQNIIEKFIPRITQKPFKFIK